MSGPIRSSRYRKSPQAYARGYNPVRQGGDAQNVSALDQAGDAQDMTSPRFDCIRSRATVKASGQ
jgi:hypothetical protein